MEQILMGIFFECIDKDNIRKIENDEELKSLPEDVKLAYRKATQECVDYLETHILLEIKR